VLLAVAIYAHKLAPPKTDRTLCFKCRNRLLKVWVTLGKKLRAMVEMGLAKRGINAAGRHAPTWATTFIEQRNVVACSRQCVATSKSANPRADNGKAAHAQTL
jgi:hypothetical protein